jgi:hypothetical protein
MWPPTLALAASVASLTSVASVASAAPFAGPGAVSAPAPTRPVAARLGVMGELLLHPGGFVGVEKRLLGGARGEILAAVTLASYVHARNHVGVMLYPEIGGRLRLNRRVALEVQGGLGYLHTFLAAPLYTVDDQGAVRRTRDRGRPAVMPTTSIGVSVATGDAVSFLHIQAFGQYPFNQSMLLHLALLLGVRL